MLIDIDPKVDYAFKRIFGVPGNTPILIDLLQAVLELPDGRRITDLEIQNPFNEKEFQDDKVTVVDIKARDQEGRFFNVEMQMLTSSVFTRRILYYWARLYQQQLQAGEEYGLLQPTYSICFVDDVLFPDSPSHHSDFRLRDKEHKMIFADELSIHLIELPKFRLAEEELRTSLDRWSYFLRYSHVRDRPGARCFGRAAHPESPRGFDRDDPSTDRTGAIRIALEKTARPPIGSE